MAIGYFKTFTPDDISFQPFTANKQWTVSDGAGLSSTTDITGSYYTASKVYTATFSSASQNGFVSGSSTEPISQTKYGFILHSNIDHMFYRYALKGLHNDTLGRPCQSFDPFHEHRDLHRTAKVISIPQEIIGEGIKRVTVNVLDKAGSTIRLKDDGYANLIDTSINTGSLVRKNELLFHIPFSEGYKYDGSYPNKIETEKGYKTRVISLGRYNTEKPGLHYDGALPHIIAAQNVKFVQDGKHGYGLGLIGHSASFVVAKRQGPVQPEMGLNDDFAISMWLKIPTSQSVSQSYYGSHLGTGEQIDGPTTLPWSISRRRKVASGENVIATRKMHPEGGVYPFHITVGNHNNFSKQGKVSFKRSDGTRVVGPTTTGSFNDNIWRHWLFQKTGSRLEIYVNGIRVGNEDDINPNVGNPLMNDIVTRHTYIGGQPNNLQWKLVHRDGGFHESNYKPKAYENDKWVYHQPDQEEAIHAFTGSIDEFRIYNQSIHSESIALLSSSVTNTNIVGNIFYDYGLAVITDPRSKYQNMFSGTGQNGWYVNFQNKHTIYEQEYYCHIRSSEYKLSMNPTLRENNTIIDDKIKGMASHSKFSPYITTIGLYDDNFDLLAVAKMGQPIKKPSNMDTTIVVRFDR